MFYFVWTFGWLLVDTFQLSVWQRLNVCYHVCSSKAPSVVVLHVIFRGLFQFIDTCVSLVDISYSILFSSLVLLPYAYSQWLDVCYWEREYPHLRPSIFYKSHWNVIVVLHNILNGSWVWILVLHPFCTIT